MIEEELHLQKHSYLLNWKSWCIGLSLQLPIVILLLFFFSIEAKQSLDLSAAQGMPTLIFNEGVQSLGRFPWVIAVEVVLLSLFYVTYLSRISLTLKRSSIEFLSIAFLLHFGCALMALQIPGAMDDPYIDYRYVLNWLRGVSFDYNPGERVMGFTSHFHLFILYVSAHFMPGLDLAAVSQVVNIILRTCCGLGVYVLMRESVGTILAILAVYLFVASPYAVQQVIVGKESSLIELLIVLSLVALHRSKTRLFAWASTFLSLTRPEGFVYLLAALLKTRDLWSDKKKYAAVWAFPLGLVAACYLFLFCYFGTVLPHGYVGRSHMFHTFQDLPDYAAHYVTLAIGSDTLGHLLAGWLSPTFSAAIAWTVQGIFVLLLLRELSREIDWLRFYNVPVLLLVACFIVFNPWMFTWYYGWFSLIYVFLVPLIVRKIWLFAKSSSSLAVRSLCAFVLLIVIAPAFARLPPAKLFEVSFWNPPALVAQAHRTFLSSLFQYTQDRERLVSYAHAARDLAAMRRDWGVVAAFEPGVFTYNLAVRSPNCKVVDLGGLLDDRMPKYYPPPTNQRTLRPVWCSVPVHAVLDIKPDYLIFPDVFGDNGLLKNREFLSLYHLMAAYPGRNWGGKGVLVYSRWSQTPVNAQASPSSRSEEGSKP